MRLKRCGIYCIENKVNGKKYFGQSINLVNRKSCHRTKLRGGTHKNSHLQSAWNKYGEENFSIYTVLECDESELDRLETELIENNRTNCKECGYNSDSGGNKNKHRSLETRNKMSKIMSGRTYTDEHKRNISKSHLGKPMHPNTKKALTYAISNPTPDARKKMSESAKNRVMTEETKNKLSKLFKGKPASLSNRISISESRGGKLLGVRQTGKNRWQARVVFNSKPISIGTFSSEAIGMPTAYLERIKEYESHNSYS